jgi:hypothetical protein
MDDGVAPREHAINRGLFQRTTIGGIEADSFVLLVLLTAASVLPVFMNLRKMWWFFSVPIFVFGAGYLGLSLLFRMDPRFFAKIRHFFRWNSTFRARPSMIASVKGKGK